MKLKQFILLGFLLRVILTNSQNKTSRIGILILGSNHPTTLNARVDTSYQLFDSMEKVDYIIVSGGCDAHNSGFCEASKMKDLLVSKGISKDLIYKEEQSKSTFQNYCYSRQLKNPNGENLIRVDDSLYVVSNHWHAIPLAARFRKYDSINAQYYIVGKITPKPDDKVNYSEIYSDKTSDCICKEFIKD